MKLWLIAKSNMRKKKGNAVVLFLLIALATMLLYTSISVLKNINTFFDDKNEAQNGAHISMALSDTHQEEIEEILESAPGFVEMESEPIISFAGTCDIKNATKNQKKESMSILFGDLSEERTISNWSIVDKGETLKKNSIVLPMYLKVANDYETGDTVQISMGTYTEEFEVYGFVEDVMFATPSNVMLYRCMISQDMMQELKENVSAMVDYRFYNARIEDVTKSSDFENQVLKKINNQIEDPKFICMLIVNFTMMKGGTSMFINILMAVLAAFSIMVIIISLVVIQFSITSNLENNLPNIGISEALGYTTKQLVQATMLEYVIVAAGGIVAGFAGAGVASGYVTGVVSGAIGLSWIPQVDFAVALLTIGIIVVLILGILSIATRKYKKITPLDALRVGISTHNFKKNHLPLSKWNFGLQSTLGIKALLHNKKQNFSIILIVALLVYTSVLCLSMYYNFVGDTNALINLVGMEKPNIQITYQNDGTDIDGSVLREEAATLEKREEVLKTNLVGSSTVTILNDKTEMSVTTDVFDQIEKKDVDTLVEGRTPKHDNEINITNVVAQEFKVEVGDSITVRKSDMTESYVVVGITQQISNMGVRAALSLEGMTRLDSEFQPTCIYLYLKDGATASAEETKRLNEYYKDDARFQVVDFDESYNTVLKTFTGSLSALCVVFVIITAAVVSLIVVLLVRMKLVKEKRNMGVYKALGYTTPQLIWQTVMSFSPVVGVGATVGTVVACLTVNNVFVMMLSISGIENAGLTISAGMVVGCLVAVTVLAFVVAALSALGVRKIEPYKMIVEG